MVVADLVTNSMMADFEGAGRNISSNGLNGDDERTHIVAANSRLGGGGGGVKKYGSTATSHTNRADSGRTVVMVKHTVLPGDTLQGIALKYRVSTEQIRRANRIWANDSLFLRATLDIPVPRSSTSSTSSDKLSWDDDDDDADDEVEQQLDRRLQQQLPSPSTTGNLLEVVGSNGDRQCSSRRDSATSDCSEHPLIWPRSESGGGGGGGACGGLESGNGSGSGDGCSGSVEPTFNDIFLRIDNSIAQSRWLADKRERRHELYDGCPGSPLDGGGRTQHRARMRNSLRADADSPDAEMVSTPRVTVHPVVVTQGRKVQSSLQRIQRQQDEIFEL